MKVARFFTDEHISSDLVRRLRVLGHDVLMAREAGRADLGIGDPDVLTWATQQGRAVLTINNWDYRKQHLRGQKHAGVVSITDDRDEAAQAARVDAAVRALPSLENQYLRVTKPPPAPKRKKQPKPPDGGGPA